MRVLGVIQYLFARFADWHEKQKWMKACRRYMIENGMEWRDAYNLTASLHQDFGHNDPIDVARNEMTHIKMEA